MYAPSFGRWAAVLSVCATVGIGAARANESPVVDWSGFYVGAHLGGALSYDTFANPYGPSVFGDEVRSPGPFIGLQGGYNYQFGQAVVGLEADLSWAGLSGSFTCLQTSHGVPAASPQFIGGAFGSTCESSHDWFGTLAARAGIAVGPQGRLFLYGKGGLAFLQTDTEMAINNSQWPDFGPSNSRSQSSFTEWGWTLGGGVEYAATRRWSVGLDYSYLGFDGHGLATPQSAPFADPGFPGILGATASSGAVSSLTQDLHAVKVSLNYHLGDSVWEADAPLDPVVVPAADSGWETEFGGRYVYAWTRFQKDLGRRPFALPVNNSRLTWKDIGTSAGEFFGRIDTPENIMVKGFVGFGKGEQGHIFDEDWGNDAGDPPAVVTGYQVTESATKTKLDYFTADLGYDVLRGDGYKVAPFFGYNYFHYRMSAFNCTFGMFAPARPCDPTDPPRQLILQEEDRWISWRLGTSAEVRLAPGLKLTGDFAYLPLVRFSGRDNHPLRTSEGFPTTFSPERGRGTGVQLEGILSYDLTDDIGIGVGGRYWAFTVPSGTTNFFTTGEYINQRFAAEQASVFVQGSYKFNGD